MAWPSGGTLSTLLEQRGGQWLQKWPQFSSGPGSNSSGDSFARRDVVAQPLIRFFAHTVTLCIHRGSKGVGARTGLEQTALPKENRMLRGNSAGRKTAFARRAFKSGALRNQSDAQKLSVQVESATLEISKTRGVSQT